jgi:hypothetical protein
MHLCLSQVLGSNSRAFPVIFEKTQKKLRHLFGMELCELASKEKPTAAGAKKRNLQFG